MKIKICKMKPSYAKPTTITDMSLCLYAAEINTFSLLSGLQVAIFFSFIYLLSVTECNFPPPLLKVLAISISAFRLFARYCRLYCWCGAEQEVKLFKKTGDKEMHAIC